MWQLIIDNINISNGIGLLGIMIGYYLYAKAKPFEHLTYIIVETSIISVDKHKYGEKLEVMFDGKLVPRATAARMLLWNTGNSPIEPQDFLAKVPLHIVGAEGVNILSHKIIHAAAPENITELTPVLGESGEHEALRVMFDVIRPREGFLCELLHTGAKGDLKAGGLLRRSSKGLMRTTAFMDGSSMFEFRSNFARMLFPVFLLVVIIIVISTFYIFSYLLVGALNSVLINYVSASLFEKIGGAESVQFYSAAGTTGIFSLWALNDSLREWRRRPSKQLRDAFAQTS
ncbi:hypothetical protein O9X98_25385 [Agrobacterium salinitolerans]|nr:hypothetical protein [Agrobacterium salinitolerans]